jgi:predicted dehydrogenase
MKIVNVGIIGYGLSGRLFHGAIINALEGFCIKKVVTTNLEKRAQALEDLPSAKVVRASTEVFVDEEIDLVVIATPNDKHAELAEAAMKAGKHVVVEKPFTVTTEEAHRLIEVAKETGKSISVYHNRRFDSDYRTVKALLETDKLGRIVEYEARFDRFRPDFKENSWKEKELPGSGMLYDLGSHLIDQALDLFGKPEAVYGDIRSLRQGITDDSFELILYYPDIKVTLKSSMLVKEPSPRFTLYGTKGSYSKYGVDVQEGELRNGQRPENDRWGLEPRGLWGTIDALDTVQKVKSLRGDYRDYYQNVYRHLVDGEPLLVTAEDGKMVIKIIEAAIKSNAEKRRIEIE